MTRFPRFIAAAVQAAPVYLNREATVDKACRLIREAGASGARLAAFGEVFVPGFPYWNYLDIPHKTRSWHLRLYEHSVDVPGPEVDRLCEAARGAHVNVVIGVNERSPISPGGIYNTNLIISSEGVLLGRHRKLVPTWAEKLTHTPGDGSGLKVYRTDVGPLGTLACGENTNTLARFALLAQGELVHVANYPSTPYPEEYDLVEGIKLRAGAHSFEGKVFTVAVSMPITPEIVEMLCDSDEKRRMLSRRPCAFSGIFGPDGRLMGDGLVDAEGIVYGEIDLQRCIAAKLRHDLIGHYNRFDVFDLRVNRRPIEPATFFDGEH
ncbi:MAG: carbon-nitrogen hydrolase family protein [Syntrophales bacterium]|jgi:aliphatic nitrilase|nr:carbon-nitrogen hydrolase family protein [Syntrophales bacterium]